MRDNSVQLMRPPSALDRTFRVVPAIRDCQHLVPTLRVGTHCPDASRPPQVFVQPVTNLVTMLRVVTHALDALRRYVGLSAQGDAKRPLSAFPREAWERGGADVFGGYLRFDVADRCDQKEIFCVAYSASLHPGRRPESPRRYKVTLASFPDADGKAPPVVARE